MKFSGLPLKIAGRAKGVEKTRRERRGDRERKGLEKEGGREAHLGDLVS